MYPYLHAQILSFQCIGPPDSSKEYTTSRMLKKLFISHRAERSFSVQPKVTLKLISTLCTVHFGYQLSLLVLVLLPGLERPVVGALQVLQVLLPILSIQGTARATLTDNQGLQCFPVHAAPECRFVVSDN